LPVTARDLIDGKPFPTVIAMNASMLEAVMFMQRRDFSQLPIVDSSCSTTSLLNCGLNLRAKLAG
jgi:predicted transcriptional regulator